jgi:hypothetical protein
LEALQKVRAKKIKDKYVIGSPKWPLTQFWSLEILGVNWDAIP